jgi:hypothetical protein
MTALDKEQEKKKLALIDAIRAAHAELETAIKGYNVVMEEEKDKVQGKLNILNEKIEEAKEWVESIAWDMQYYYDGETEDWQESENGQDYLAWKDEYEAFSTDSVDVDFPNDLDMPECDLADELENLPN